MTDGEGTSRRDELTLAAAQETLSAEDRTELDALRVGDPTVDAEIAALHEVLVRLESFGAWDESAPSPDLGERVVTAVDLLREPGARRERRWRPVVVAASAVLLAGIVGGGLLVGSGDGAPDGQTPVGALGTTERLQVQDVAREVDLRASVVAHRWGVETVLDADGLAPGREYDLVVVEDDGEEVAAGGFLGAARTVHCHLNAPVMRADAVLLQVREAGGAVVGWARLPTVTD